MDSRTPSIFNDTKVRKYLWEVLFKTLCTLNIQQKKILPKNRKCPVPDSLKSQFFRPTLYKILRNGIFDRFSLEELTPHQKKSHFKESLHANEAYIYIVI